MSDSKERLKVDGEGLRKIFELSAKRLIILAAEGEDDLLQIVHRKAEESQEKDKDKLTVTFTHRITVDFVKNTQRDTLGGTMKVQVEIEGERDDPDQGELFGKAES